MLGAGVPVKLAAQFDRGFVAPGDVGGDQCRLLMFTALFWCWKIF
jgi:hypothetical protein